MIRVHHLERSRSHRVLWLLEELGLPYELVLYMRDRKTMLAPGALRGIHPLGKSPVVEIDGRMLAESGAIIEGVLFLHGQGRLQPERGSDAWFRYIYWLHYAEGSLMSPLLLKLVLGRLGPLGWPAQKYVNSQIARHLEHGALEDQGGALAQLHAVSALVRLARRSEARLERRSRPGRCLAHQEAG